MGRGGARERAVARVFAARRGSSGPRRTTPAGRIEFFVQAARDLGRATPLDEGRYLKNPHAAIEGNGDDIARAHRAACAVDTLAVDTYAARCRKACGGGARAHDPRVPQPLVDSLLIPVQDSARSMTLSENRYPPRIESGAGFFGIVL
jgi:hypothetical protein